VSAVRIGKAVAWRCYETKPVVAIIAKPGTARIVKLSLGDKYNYYLTTNTASLRESFVLITDNVHSSKTSDIPVILIGAHDEESYCLPELFDVTTLKMLVKKVLHEQTAPSVRANAEIVVEHFDDFEETLGIDKADELLKLLHRLLREAKVPFKQFERTTFLIDGELPETTLLDVEQTFHLILAHVYGRMVTPGEQINFEGIVHIVPSLTITFATQFEEELDDAA
jgi:hypothetical protein